MRLLIATGLYPPEIGGPATYSKMLHDELPQRGVEVSVLPFSGVRALPVGVRHIVYLLKLLKRGFAYDLIYAQDAVSVGLPAALAAFLLRKPLWVRIPGDYAWEQGVQRFGVTDTLDVFVKKTAHSIPVRMLRSLQTFVIRRAQCVIVPSEYMAKIVALSGIQKSKIRVVYSSVSEPKIAEGREELRERLGLHGKVIVSAGRLVPWKGMEELISTFAELLREMPEATLVIVGDGPLRESLLKHAKAVGIEGSVRFTGTLPQGELFAYLKAADVFVLNTAYEGLSHQLIEVMMMGTPLVTTSVGGNPELIHSEEEGLLVPYNDGEALGCALRRVLTTPGLGEALSGRALKRSTEFTSKNALTQLLGVFKEFDYIN